MVNDLVELLDKQVLAKHKSHVCLDLSWVVFEDYLIQKDEEGEVVVDEEGDPRIRPEWIAFIEKYPDNFILGSDKVGTFKTYRSEIRKYNALLKCLKPETRTKVANGNFLRVMPKVGLTLPEGYIYPEKRYTRRVLPTKE